MVRDIWANKTHDPISGKYKAVGAHDTALLVVTEVHHVPRLIM